MNSPIDQQPDHTSLEARVVRLEDSVDQLGVRVVRLEVTVEHLVSEFREFRAEVREEMRSFRAEMRREFQKVYAAMFTLTVGLAGVMAHGFGWI